MEAMKPSWLQILESGQQLEEVDLSHVRTGAGASGVIPLLAYDHMQALVAVLEANLATLRKVNLNGLRIGDVGLSSLVDRVLTKENCQINTLDMRQNALSSSGLRQAIMKMSVLNYTLSSWMLEETGGGGAESSTISKESTMSQGSMTTYNATFASKEMGTIAEGGAVGGSNSSSASAASSSNGTRPGPSATMMAKKEKEKEKERVELEKMTSNGASPSNSSSSSSSSSSGTLRSEPREITLMTFNEIVSKYVAEFCRLNTEIVAALSGTSSSLSMRFNVHKHPRLCPTRMAKLVLQLTQVTSLSIEGWTPPPPLSMKHQEKKLAKLSPEQIAFKELKRTVPGTLFASLPKLTELRLVKCGRVDMEKAKKGTLRGVFGKAKSPSPIVKSTFIPSLPPELGAMPSLRRLTLSECGLTELTPSVLPFLSHVELLDLGINYIPLIPPQISSLSNVTRLFLHQNNLTDIPSEISSMRFLRELWLFDNHITSCPADIAKWFPVLKDLRILSQRLDESYVMDDPVLLELRRQEDDLIASKSSIGCIGFLGMLKLLQAPSITLYRTSTKKKK